MPQMAARGLNLQWFALPLRSADTDMVSPQDIRNPPLAGGSTDALLGAEVAALYRRNAGLPRAVGDKTMTVDERMEQVYQQIELVRGVGDRRRAKLCIMSFVALLAGESHTDSPDTASAVLREILETTPVPA